MGLSCSKEGNQTVDVLNAVPDPEMYDFWRRSVELLQRGKKEISGQTHLLYKHQNSNSSGTSNLENNDTENRVARVICTKQQPRNNNNNHQHQQSLRILPNKTNKQSFYPTRLLIRRHAVRNTEEGISGTHIYACRWAAENQEQCPTEGSYTERPRNNQESAPAMTGKTRTNNKCKSAESLNSTQNTLGVHSLFSLQTMSNPPSRKGQCFGLETKTDFFHQ